MAELQNIPIQDATMDETPTVPEQQERAQKPARRKQQNTKNGANGTNGTHSATPKKPRAKKPAARAHIEVDDSANAGRAADAQARKRAPSKKSTTSTRRKAAKPLKKEEEALSEFEDTVARPAPRAHLPVDIQATQEAQVAPLELEVEAERPLIPASEPADIPETSLSPVDEKDAPTAVKTPPAVEPERPAPPVIAWPESPLLIRRRGLKRVVMLLALIVFVASSLLLWRNANETHLYLYRIDLGNGQTLTQQDLGGYASIHALSNVAQDQSTVLLGVSPASPAQQQVLSLEGNDGSWRVTRRFSTLPGRSTLSIGPGNLLAVESGSGLQVMSSDGRARWQAGGNAPMLGAHPFTPAFDSSSVYTIQSASKGMVSAYNAYNGTARWTVQLQDTLNYAPPLLLMGDTLYVAGDHTLYALNTITGGTHWKVDMAARTLLSSAENAPAIIAAGASGLAAFDPQSGTLLWSFNGQPDTSSAHGDGNALTAAQFYQAGLMTSSNTVYATGLVWDTRQMQQQLWLFAVDASSGKPAWLVQIGTGFTNADGGRVFAPFIDAPHKLIMIEQVLSDGSHTLSAFDSGDGFQHWSARFAAVSASAPNVIALSSDSLGIFSAQTDAGLALRAGWGLRLLLILAIASLLALLLLWILPLKNWLSNASRRARRLPHYAMALLRKLRRLWRFSRLLLALTLAAAFICAGILTYRQLNQMHPYVKQVGAGNGSAMWQQVASTSTRLAGVDNAGVLLVKSAGDQTFELSALNSNGSPRWTLPSGEGTFSIAPVVTPAGTILAMLKGPAEVPYRYAPGDPSYSNALAHYAALYLLDSQTGRVLWQNDLVRAGALQDATVLGADSQFIYIASRSLLQNQATQLIAVDKIGGETAWRFFEPHAQANATPDVGALLARGSLIYWQVSNIVYALSTQTGQIEWRDAIAEVDARVSALEEGQMAVGQNVLLVRRSDMYHALDLASGAERWTLSGLGVDDTRAPGGIITDGSKFILYGGGSIEAFDATTQNVLWKHTNLVAVSNVSLSPDGSLVYAVVFSNLDSGINVQALVAFDANSNLVHWTFQPGAQLVYTGARILYNVRGMIYLASCFAGRQGTCSHQVLYGIDESTGKARWQIAARRITVLQASQDGSALTFQTSSSEWENLKAIFKG